MHCDTGERDRGWESCKRSRSEERWRVRFENTKNLWQGITCKCKVWMYGMRSQIARLEDKKVKMAWCGEHEDGAKWRKQHQPNGHYNTSILLLLFVSFFPSLSLSHSLSLGLLRLIFACMIFASQVRMREFASCDKSRKEWKKALKKRTTNIHAASLALLSFLWNDVQFDACSIPTTKNSANIINRNHTKLSMWLCVW